MLLEVSRLSFGYGKEAAVLYDIAFTLDAGCILGLLGPNGAGKSTLLKCINRIHAGTAGQILLAGKDLSRLSLKEIARDIAYVPQYTGASFPASVLYTVLMGRLPYSGYSFTRKDRQAAKQALEKVELTAYAAKDIRTLSGGERQRAYIARALAGEPKLILMDEPTSSLDVKYQIEILRMIRGLVRDMGMSVIITVHDLNLASLFCDRIILLKKGRIWTDGLPAEVLNEKNIRQIYGIEVFTADAHGKRYVQLLDEPCAEEHEEVF